MGVGISLQSVRQERAVFQGDVNPTALHSALQADSVDPVPRLLMTCFHSAAQLAVVLGSLLPPDMLTDVRLAAAARFAGHAWLRASGVSLPTHRMS